MKPTIQLRFLTAVVCGVLLASVAAAAQFTATLSGPVLGYVFDGDAQKLRPISGIMGSATVGEPVALGFAVSQVLTLDARHVIASTDSSPELLTVDLEVNPVVARAISGGQANPSQAAASLQGTSAAFYYAEAQQVLVVTGLPRNPAASHRVDLSRLGKPLTHMAVSNDGTLLVVALDDGGSEALYGWTASSDSARFLTAAVSIGGMAITGNGAAIVADRGADEVFAIWDAGGPAIRQFLAGNSDGVSSPAGVVWNNNRIYIGNTGSATVTVLDSDGRYLETHSCSCTLSGVYPMRDSVFRLTDRIDRTIFLLDASSAEERIVFVPPAQRTER
jgi:hypothetical protein